VNNWVLLAATFFVTFGTALPPVFKAITGNEVNVGVPFFNRWMIPIGLILLFLTGVGPLLSWRKSTGATIRQQFVVPVIVGVGTFLALYFGLGIRHWPALATISLCTFVTWTIIQEFWRGTRHRMRNAEENALDAFLTLINRARRRYGGYVIHFGIVVMFFGFAGEAFKKEEDRRVAKGEMTSLGRYDMRLDDLTFEDDGQKNMITAHVTVFEQGTQNVIGKLRPAKWFYRKPEDQQTTEVDKRMSFRDDLYLVLGGYDAEASTAVLQVKVNPLVNFVWLGCMFLMLGFAIAVWPERRTADARVPVRRFIPAAAGATTLLLGILSAILAFI
jgi:cytochrome c-type biogenesis protein CcmF